MTNYALIAKKWYDKNRWSKERLQILVQENKITSDDYKEITGEDYNN